MSWTIIKVDLADSYALLDKETDKILMLIPDELYEDFLQLLSKAATYDALMEGKIKLFETDLQN